MCIECAGVIEVGREVEGLAFDCVLVLWLGDGWCLVFNGECECVLANDEVVILDRECNGVCAVVCVDVCGV